MSTATRSQSISLAGRLISWSAQVTADAEELWDPTPAIGVAATTWAKTGASTGTMTVASDCGLAGSFTGDFYWTDVDGNLKRAYGCACTYSATTVTVGTFGAGDTIPNSSAAYSMVICPQTDVTCAFVGNDLIAFAAIATDRSTLVLVDDSAGKHVFDLSSTGGVVWADGDANASPLAGITIASATISTANTTSSQTVTWGIMYDATL